MPQPLYLSHHPLFLVAVDHHPLQSRNPWLGCGDGIPQEDFHRLISIHERSTKYIISHLSAKTPSLENQPLHHFKTISKISNVSYRTYNIERNQRDSCLFILCRNRNDNGRKHGKHTWGSPSVIYTVNTFSYLSQSEAAWETSDHYFQLCANCKKKCWSPFNYSGSTRVKKLYT